MGRKRKATVQEGEEKYPIAVIRVRNDLVVREDHLHRFREEPSSLGLGQIILGDGGSRPAHDRSSLQKVVRHGAVEHDELNSHTMEGAWSGIVQQWHAGAGDRREEEEEAATAKSK
jgi:hypothetical protein